MFLNVIMDVIVAAILVLFAVMGARKGLWQSVTGLVIVVAALVGAAVAANIITPVISTAVRPILMDMVEEKVSGIVEKMGTTGENQRKISAKAVEFGSFDLKNIDLSGITLPEGFEIPENFTWPEDFTLPEGIDMDDLMDIISGLLPEIDPALQLNALLGQLGIDPELAASLVEAALEKMEETGISAVEALVQVVVETVVHAIVFLVAFIVLVILLKILLAAMGLVLLLPGLRTLNELGGAVVALVEGALVLFLLVWVARRCAVDVAGMAEGTFLLRFFVNNTPLSVLSFL